MTFNWLWFGDAIWQHGSWPALIHVMAYGLFITKPIPEHELVLTYFLFILYHEEWISLNFQFKEHAFENAIVFSLEYVKWLYSDGAIQHHGIWLLLVQVMVWCQSNTKPLPKPNIHFLSMRSICLQIMERVNVNPLSEPSMTYHWWTP